MPRPSSSTDDAGGRAGERLVGGVVDHFLDDVQRRVGPGVHPRAFLDGLEALQDADASFVVAGGHAGEWFGESAILRERRVGL